MFRVGDRVRILESSHYYRDGDVCNPIDIFGTVVRFKFEDFEQSFDHIRIIVEWDNGTTNGYDDCDLISIKEVRKRKIKRCLE